MSISYKKKMILFWLAVAVSTAGFTKLFLLMNLGAFFGWVYSLAFALSALPQSRKSIKEGHSDGVADGTLFLWILGEFAGLVYGFSLMQLPIIFNCLLNTLFVGIIIWYRLFPRT